METLATVVDVVLSYGGDAHSAVERHEYCVLGFQNLDHFGSKSGVCEHSDLLHDMAPVVFASKFGQFLDHLDTVSSKSSTHFLDLFVPLSLQGFICQNGLDDPGTMNWWVGVFWKACVFEQGLNLDLLVVILAYHGETPCSFTIKPKVFGKRLSKHHSIVVFSEVSNTEVVEVIVIIGETLVRGVEKAEVLLLLAYSKDLLPLVNSWVTS